MPNRILKESICVSDSIDRLTWFEEVLFYRLIVNCDDYGRYDGRPAIIKNKLFPLKENLTLKAVTEAINKLASIGIVSLYEFEGKTYLRLLTWNEHQNVRAKRSKYPEPPESSLQASAYKCMQVRADDSKCEQVNTEVSKCEHPHAYVPVIQSESLSESESESNTKKSARARAFHPPTVDEVSAYCHERGNAVNAQRFVDFYASKGWLIGKTKMVDWKAAVRTWERREQETSSGSGNVFADIVNDGRLEL